MIYTSATSASNSEGVPATVAVLIPFHYHERLDWLQQAIDSVHEQQTRHTLRIYLGIDGPIEFLPDRESVDEPTSAQHQIKPAHTALSEGDTFKTSQYATDKAATIFTEGNPTQHKNNSNHADQSDKPTSQAATIPDFLTLNQAKIYRIVNNPVNQGLAVMLNRMIDELEHEEFIIRLDADDIALPGRAEIQINWLLGNPETDVCGGYMIETDFQQYEKLVTYPLSHNEIARISHRRNPIAHPACAVRRKVYHDKNRYPTDALYNEDLGMWLQLLEKGYRFANIPAPLIKFRVRPDFYRKRGYLMALIELKLYLRRLKTTKAPLSAFVFPLMRFVFRFMPSRIKKLGYRSDFRLKL
jgi:glycosyltransferase involved in cell wall biosynthesis